MRMPTRDEILSAERDVARQRAALGQGFERVGQDVGRNVHHLRQSLVSPTALIGAALVGMMLGTRGDRRTGNSPAMRPGEHAGDQEPAGAGPTARSGAAGALGGLALALVRSRLATPANAAWLYQSIFRARNRSHDGAQSSAEAAHPGAAAAVQPDRPDASRPD
jgi:hypothetical protein